MLKMWVPALRSSVKNAAPRPGHGTPSPLQEFAGLVERAKRKAGLRKVFGRAFLAVDHGEHQCDLATGVAHRFDRLHRRTAGRGDVLDDHHALSAQALALCQSFDGELRAVLFRLLADEEGRDRMTFDPGKLRDRAG